MRIVFMGTPVYAVPVLEALLSLGTRVVGVYTQPGKPVGRGRTPGSPPVKTSALDNGIEVFQPPSLRRAEVQQQLASLTPDLIVVAAYGKILPQEVLDIPVHGCVNVHPSLLPRYRGPSPVATAILGGDKETGTTIMLLDEGMDSGPILASRTVPIHPSATTGCLTQSLFRLGAELLTETLPLWLKGEVTPQPQVPSQATATQKLEKAHGEAKWVDSAEELERRVRAFTPWPGFFTFWKGRTLKILSVAPLSVPLGPARPVEQIGLSPGTLDLLGKQLDPGRVVTLDEPGIAAGVVTGRGILGLKVLQIEGKRPASSEEFMRGYRDFLGSRLPS